MKSLLTAALAATLCVVCGSVTATPLKLSPLHKDKYSAGVKKQSAGDFAAALASFEAIPSEARHYDTRLHIATCRQRLGQLTKAASELEDIIATAKSDAKLSPSDRDAIVETAQSDLDEVKKDMPRLTVRVSAATPTVAVTLNGEAIVPPIERSLDPGVHLIVATRDGVEVFRREAKLDRGSTETVEIDLPAPAKTNAPSPPPPAIKPDESRPNTLAYVGFGGAAVFAALSAGSFVARSSALDDFKRSCDQPTDCDRDVASSVRRWEAIAFTSAGVAVVGLGIGTYALIRGTTKPVTVAVTPFGVQLFGRF